MEFIKLFSTEHIMYILFFTIFYSFLLYIRKFINSRFFEISVASTMGIIKILGYIGRYYINHEPLYALFPIHICNVSFFMAVIFMIKPNIKAFQIIFYMSLGALAAILFPESVVVFPNPFGILFFLEHFFILFMIIYQMVYLNFRPTKKGIFHTFIGLNILAVVAYNFNKIFNTNYMYINHKPLTPTPLDLFGPWPIYILVVEVLFIFLGFLFYLLFRKRK
ncbi:MULTISPECIES: TIGR02206 family membrane protein [Fusobacterium]|uniref:YwaF family protein n=1 Tax=Fusobacterium TaxID=848 RepID=UPI0014774626|nr:MULTISPECIES: TIGR02206 family membrane protein [Fusobacterium]NME35664.1 TIGR02206 family membrane protein [Fusobacterium sp. FSA-380-WT-3A]